MECISHHIGRCTSSYACARGGKTCSRGITMTLDQVWSDIRAKIGNRSASPPFGRFPEIVLTKPQKSHLDRSFCWLIGPFLAVREIAEFLRSEKGLQDELTVLNVRIGRRETDLPPQG